MNENLNSTQSSLLKLGMVCASRMGSVTVTLIGKRNMFVTLSLDRATHEGPDAHKKEIFFCFFSFQ